MPEPRHKVELHDSPALDQYATWRPRLARAAKWAIPTGALAKVLGGDRKGALHIAVPTILAGIAGASDKTIEEKLRARAHNNQKAQAIIDRGFEERVNPMPKIAAATDTSLFPEAAVTAAEREASIVLTGLTRHKGVLAERADSQLRALFPEAGGKDSSLGRGVRISTGRGSIATMLSSIR